MLRISKRKAAPNSRYVEYAVDDPTFASKLGARVVRSKSRGKSDADLNQERNDKGAFSDSSQRSEDEIVGSESQDDDATAMALVMLSHASNATPAKAPEEKVSNQKQQNRATLSMLASAASIGNPEDADPSSDMELLGQLWAMPNQPVVPTPYDNTIGESEDDLEQDIGCRDPDMDIPMDIMNLRKARMAATGSKPSDLSIPSDILMLRQSRCSMTLSEVHPTRGRPPGASSGPNQAASSMIEMMETDMVSGSEEDDDAKSFGRRAESPREAGDKVPLVWAPLPKAIVTPELLHTVYHLPINEAAGVLGLGTTILKKICRSYNVTRWPYRKLQSIDKMMEVIQAELVNKPETSEANLALLQRLRGVRQQICREPDILVPEDIRKLRQSYLDESKRLAMCNARASCASTVSKQPWPPSSALPQLTSTQPSVAGSVSMDVDADGTASEDAVEDEDLEGDIKVNSACAYRGQLTKEMLHTVYNLPISEAASKLGIGTTILKKFCRSVKITRWPYRKLQSIDKMVEAIEADMRDKPEYFETATKMLKNLAATRDMVIQDPGMQLPDSIRKLRQASFLDEFKRPGSSSILAIPFRGKRPQSDFLDPIVVAAPSSSSGMRVARAAPMITPKTADAMAAELLVSFQSTATERTQVKNEQLDLLGGAEGNGNLQTLQNALQWDKGGPMEELPELGVLPPILPSQNGQGVQDFTGHGPSQLETLLESSLKRLAPWPVSPLRGLPQGLWPQPLCNELTDMIKNAAGQLQQSLKRDPSAGSEGGMSLQEGGTSLQQGGMSLQQGGMPLQQGGMSLLQPPLDSVLARAKAIAGAGQMIGQPTLPTSNPSSKSDHLKEMVLKLDSEANTSIDMLLPAAKLPLGTPVSLELLSTVFHLPMGAASTKLGMTQKMLRKYCVAFGIMQWPNVQTHLGPPRSLSMDPVPPQVSTIDELAEAIQADVQFNPVKAGEATQALLRLSTIREQICLDPNLQLPDDIKRLSQSASYMIEFYRTSKMPVKPSAQVIQEPPPASLPSPLGPVSAQNSDVTARVVSTIPPASASAIASAPTAPVGEPASGPSTSVTAPVQQPTQKAQVFPNPQSIPNGPFITKEKLSMFYHVPANDAAAKLGLGVTTLKKWCRSFNIVRWPFRQLLSIEKLKEAICCPDKDRPESLNVTNPEALLEKLEKCRQQIYENPAFEMPTDIKRLRQAMFKNEYKQRQHAGVLPKARKKKATGAETKGEGDDDWESE